MSVSSIENSNQTKIFPNPAVEKINIEFTSNKIQKMNFDIIDAKGQMIDHIMNAYVNHGINTFSFETQNLPKGIYFLNISNDQKIIKHEKFVVH